MESTVLENVTSEVRTPEKVVRSGARIGQDFEAREVAAQWNAHLLSTDALHFGRFSVRAGQRVAAIWERDGERVMGALRWGLIPWWTPESSVREGRRIVWARQETLGRKASFRQNVARHRALIPVSGWFARIRERVLDENDLPSSIEHILWLRPRSGGVWALPALWDEWTAEDGRTVATCAIVSTPSNARLAKFGVRMPAMLKAGADDAWLRGREDGGAPHNWQNLLATIASRDLHIDVVSAPRWREQDDATLIEPTSDSEAILERLGLNAPVKSLKLRRQIRRDWQSPDGQIFFKVRSFTRDDATRWHPTVDVHDGKVWCDCPDFRYRHAANHPDVWHPQHWCKHVQRAVKQCVRRGDLELRFRAGAVEPVVEAVSAEARL